MINLPRLKLVLYFGPDHDRGNPASTTLRDRRTAAEIGVQVALIPNDEKEPVATRLKLGAAQDCGKVLRQPGIGLRTASVVTVMLQVRCDVSVIWVA